MAEENNQNTAPAPQTQSASKAGGFVKRELNGASFLTLEHVGHMVAVVVIAALLSAGAAAAIGLWGNNMSWLFASGGSTLDLLGAAGAYTMPLWAIGLVSALLIVTPLLVALSRRTRAEWAKRPGYTSRVAYKAPVYTALGVIAAVIVALTVQLLSVILSSLALIGIQGADIGGMYLYQFLPALIALLLFSAAGWYVFMLAKGQDNGRLFSAAMSALSIVVIVTLFLTAVLSLQAKQTIYPMPVAPWDGVQQPQSLEDVFRY